MTSKLIKEKDLLVVGGTGFIGRGVVYGGIKRGYRVSVLSRSLPEPKNIISGVEYLQADISSDVDVLKAVGSKHISHAVNLGGDISHVEYRNGGLDIINSHLTGVLNLAHSLDRNYLKCFVQIGSSDEYGIASAPQYEDLPCLSMSSYSFSKFAATEFLKMLHKTESFPAIIVRPFLVYGPGQGHQRFLPQVISACLKDVSFASSNGEQLRDFCYINDIVDGLFSALESKDCYGEVFNLASGRPISIRSMIECVVDLIGGGKPQFGTIQYRAGESMVLYANIKKAKERLNWSPVINLREGLEKTIEYYRGV